MSTATLPTPSSATSPANTGRSASLGIFSGVSSSLSEAQTVAMYRQVCFNREFEFKVFEALKTKKISTPAYLSVGQEHIPASIAQVFPRPMIFAQHRAHSYFLSFGGKPESLRDELLGMESGCAQGKGGSASIHNPALPMFGHSGLMGDQIPIAVGAAMASGRPTLAITGDASVEEDYVFGAIGYAVTKQAPVLFVCEDNDLSILTPLATRRSWNMRNVAHSLGMPAEDITDDPWLIAHHVNRLKDHLPAYLNIRTCRHLWHAGAGCDGPPEWDRYELIRQCLDELNIKIRRQALEEEAAQSVDKIWKDIL